jgi:hypothetical protein
MCRVWKCHPYHPWNPKLVPKAWKCQQGEQLDGNQADHGANSSAPMFGAWADLDVLY